MVNGTNLVAGVIAATATGHCELVGADTSGLTVVKAERAEEAVDNEWTLEEPGRRPGGLTRSER